MAASVSPMTTATALAAGALATIVWRSSDRSGRENVPIAKRAREAKVHKAGVCLIKRLTRRRALENQRAGRPRQVLVAL
jgi:hypothetical protein